MIVWVLEDEKIGTSSQAIGLASSLGIPFVHKKVKYNSFAALPNYLKFSTVGIKNAKDLLDSANPPQLVISAGRRLVNFALYLKKKYGAKVIQLMDSGWYGRHDLDLIIVPKHDKLNTSLSNVVFVSGMAHTLTDEKLDSEKNKWLHKLNMISKPSLAVIVGGSTKNHSFTFEMAKKFVHLIRSKFDGYGIMLTTSRRTGEENEHIIFDGLKDMKPYIYNYRDGGDNPYYAFLALADKIVVTGDSMSMCSEAAFTKKPVFIYAPEQLLSKKHMRFHQELYEYGCAVELNEKTDISFVLREKRFYPNEEMIKLIKQSHLIDGAFQ